MEALEAILVDSLGDILVSLVDSLMDSLGGHVGSLGVYEGDLYQDLRARPEEVLRLSRPLSLSESKILSESRCDKERVI